MLSMYYHCFAIISSWKRVGPSFEQSCIPFTQGCFAQWIFRTRFLNFIYEHVCYFVIIFPWKRAWPFIWINLTSIRSPRDALCLVWLKMAQWFWRRFLNFLDVFSLFCYYLPLKKGHSTSLEQTWIPFPDRCFVLRLLKSLSSQASYKKLLKNNWANFNQPYYMGFHVFSNVFVVNNGACRTQYSLFTTISRGCDFTFEHLWILVT